MSVNIVPPSDKTIKGGGYVSFIKQVLITLIIVIIVILIVAILFYNYLPFNKMIPSNVTAYSSPEEIKSDLETMGADNIAEQNITYSVDATELDQRQKTSSYSPGKVDPFSENTNDTNIDSSSNSGLNDPIVSDNWDKKAGVQGSGK